MLPLLEASPFDQSPGGLGYLVYCRFAIHTVRHWERLDSLRRAHMVKQHAKRELGLMFHETSLQPPEA